MPNQPGRKLMIVDADVAVATATATRLRAAGYVVLLAHSESDARLALSTTTPDLLISEVDLGSGDIRKVINDLHLISTIPLIFLTNRTHEADVVAGLHYGAAAYLTKPCSYDLLAATIIAVLRRPPPPRLASQVTTLLFDNLAIDQTAREVRIDGVPVLLTNREFELLAFLATTPRTAFSRAQLLSAIWPESAKGDGEATVTEHIRRVRAKIEKDPDNPRWITTVRGVGYRFERRAAARGATPQDSVPVEESLQDTLSSTPL
jgi:DNA-binding response OmpR family regulator